MTRWYVVDFRGSARQATAGPFPRKRDAAECVKGGPDAECWRISSGVYLPHDPNGMGLLAYVVREDRLRDYAHLHTVEE